jgi:hypothetical protein
MSFQLSPEIAIPTEVLTKHMAIIGSTGCLSGDTIIEINRAKLSKKVKIEDLFLRFNGLPSRSRRLNKRLYWDSSIPTFVRFRSDDGFIRLNKLFAALKSGIKVVYELKTEDNKVIKATVDHRFLTNEGWKKLGDLNINDFVYTDQHGIAGGWKHITAKTGLSRICSIVKIGNEMTYDLTMSEEPHNFIANGFVVHNSGKTVLIKGIVEEAVKNNIPAVIIDLQGDIASLGMRGDTSFAADSYFNNLDLKIWTPGSNKGCPLSLVPPLMVGHDIVDDESREDAWDETAAIIARLIGGKCAKNESIAALSMVLEYIQALNLEINTLSEFSELLGDPPAQLLNKIVELVDNRTRKAMAREIAVMLASPDGKTLRRGSSLDPDELFYGKKGKTRVSVMYLRNLDDTQRAVFIATLASTVFRWAQHLKGNKLNALFCIDEAAPYCPPSNQKKPPSKEALTRLLRQARKYGVGCVVATQSPGDIDYVALGQIGTWAIGRLPMTQQLDKVWPAIRTSGGDSDSLADTIPRLTAGQFVLSSPDLFVKPVEFKPRWLHSKHEIVDDDNLRYL